jgi:ATP-dependent Clp protease protease subunit
MPPLLGGINMKKMCSECEVTGSPMMLFDKIYLENLKERRIILNSEIDDSIFETVTMQVKKFNSEDEKNNISIEDRKPIEIHINSFGGSVYDGFSLVSVITTSKTPVHTYTDGYVMSMGLAIFIAGHKRFCYPFSNFMYHEVSTMAYGKNGDIERVTQENRRIQKMYDGLVIKNTKLEQKKLEGIKKTLRDWYFGAEEALEFQVVHEIIS